MIMAHDFGLIGKNISYSFSKQFFEQKFKKLMLNNYTYELFDLLTINEVEKLFSNKNLCGFNVTQPYKQSIIPYLDELSPEAATVNAVNTVLIKDGKKIGYNTDVYGFEKSLKLFPFPNDKKALILGDGGAAQAVKHILNVHQFSYQTIMRNSEKTFQHLSLDEVADHPLIVQCTPVGTFPNIDDCVPFPFEGISNKHLIIDLIYNPEQTKFMKEASKRGAKTLNGLYMLEMQAEKAWEIWNF